MDTFNETNYFSSPVYMVKKDEFLEDVSAVSSRYLDAVRKDGSVITMTHNYSHEPVLKEFCQYVSQTAWNILSAQGYAMEEMATWFSEMWTQEHNYLSSMDTHIHNNGAQISAFYFLDTPADGSQLVIHDPRPAKVIISLPVTNDTLVSGGSSHVVFTPEPGLLILMNSWLPHSFTKNGSFSPFRFVHMNLSVVINDEKKIVEIV